MGGLFTTIELREIIRNALGLAHNIINIKDLEEWFCNVITILLSPFTNNNVVEAIFYLFGGSSATFDLSQYEQFDKLEMKLQNESLKTIADRSDFKLLFSSNGIF